MPDFLSADTSEGRLLALLLDNLHLGHSGRAVNDVTPKHLQDDLVRLPQGVSLAALGMHHSTGLNLRNHIALGHGALLKARTTCLKNSNRGIGLLFLCPPASFGMPCTFACCTSRGSHCSGLSICPLLLKLFSTLHLHGQGETVNPIPVHGAWNTAFCPPLVP